ncbi:MAG: T9SS type A sorting domain-containing protein, partial [Bacteroidetes bacterium]|nr:T9SS type A sorting domain-containing protein [Bacteroidota bacterium]
ILKTTNGGSDWIAAQGTPPEASRLFSIYFTDINTGYATGDHGRVLKTIDAGNNWFSVPTNGTFNFLRSITFTDNNKGYVGGQGVAEAPGILKTIDGGISWTSPVSGANCSINSIYFIDADTGYAVGDNGKVLKTTDSGTNWTMQTIGNNYSFKSVYFTGPNTGYICGGNNNNTNGAILKTINGGNNWTTQTIGTTNDINSIFFINSNTGYAVANGGIILKTINGGTNWNVLTSGTTSDLNSIYFPDTNTAYAVGGNGTILKLSADLSYEWTPAAGLDNKNIQNPKATITNSAKYFVTAINSDGCITIDSVSVIVNSLTANAGADKTIVCGGTAQIDNVASNYTGTGVLSYNWFPVTGLDDSTIKNPKATITNNTKYYVTVSTPDGCAAIDSVNITVNSLTANAGADKTIICGGTAQLENVTSNYSGTGTLSYIWSPVTGLDNSTIKNPKVTIINNAKYYVTVTTPNGCAAIDSVNINVNSLTANAGTDKTIICGGTAQLDNVTSNYTGTGALSYNWSPVTGLNFDNIQNPTATLTENTTYTVTVTTPNSCIATNSVDVSIIPMNAIEICIVGVDSSNKNIVIWNKPPSLAIDSFYIYRETNITNVYQKISAVSYDSLSVFIDNTSSPDVQSNKYKISIKDECGLESLKSAYHKTMHLAINQGMGNTWNLIWDPYEGFTVSTYNVYRGTLPNNLQLIGTSSGANTQYSDLTAPSGYLYYQVEVVSPNSCSPSKSLSSSRSNIATNNPNGIYENNNTSGLFSIYPNPVNDKIEISVFQKSLPLTSVGIEIMNAEGQIIKSLNIRENKAVIDVSDFASGMYFVRVITSNGLALKKFIKK